MRLGERLGDGALARRRRPEDREHELTAAGGGGRARSSRRRGPRRAGSRPRRRGAARSLAERRIIDSAGDVADAGCGAARCSSSFAAAIHSSSTALRFCRDSDVVGADRPRAGRRRAGAAARRRGRCGPSRPGSGRRRRRPARRATRRAPPARTRSRAALEQLEVDDLGRRDRVRRASASSSISAQPSHSRSGRRTRARPRPRAPSGGSAVALVVPAKVDDPRDAVVDERLPARRR